MMLYAVGMAVQELRKCLVGIGTCEEYAALSCKAESMLDKNVF